MTSKLNILLVDDDKINNFISENIIKKQEVAGTVKVCLNGLEGFNYLKKEDNQIELILVDINMPIMDGLEFMEEASKLPEIKKKVVYLMHTSPLTENQKKRTSEVYLTGNILKPLSKEKLDSILQQNFAA